MNQLEEFLIAHDYDLLTLIQVNNVLGSVNPVEKIVKLRNQLRPNLLFILMQFSL